MDSETPHVRLQEEYRFKNPKRSLRLLVIALPLLPPLQSSASTAAALVGSLEHSRKASKKGSRCAFWRFDFLQS
ncbi:hypothetical protein Csa_022084 [Cucumis sativus]|nr:hypothetical protein Csa_022084 [Cucumis sativus]